MIVGHLNAQHDKSRRQMRTLAICMDYANDLPLAVIRDKYDMATATISKYARAAGLPGRRGPLPAEKEKEIIKLYRGGVKIKEIVEMANVDRKSIWRVIKDHDIQLRNPDSGKRKLTDAQVRMVRAYKGNISQLSRDLKVRRETLQRIRSGTAYKDVK